MAAELLFDSDAPDNGIVKRTFNVAMGEVARIVAAGLEASECIQIYVRVGSPNNNLASNTALHTANVPNFDFVWTPLYRCGSPVRLCRDANEYLERIPGTYLLGHPEDGVVVTGDVNVSHEKLDSRYLYVQPYCGGDMLDENFCPPLVPLGVLATW